MSEVNRILERIRNQLEDFETRGEQPTKIRMSPEDKVAFLKDLPQPYVGMLDYRDGLTFMGVPVEVCPGVEPTVE